MRGSRRDFISFLSGLPLAVLASGPTRGGTGTGSRTKRGASEPFLLNRCAVAGVRHHHASPELLRRMRPGDPLAMRAEPDNPFDEFAVRLSYEGRRIGYVPRDQNQAVARLIAQGAPVQGVITAVDPSAPPWEAVWVELSISL